ncbi:MAG TPA: YeeE/YedE thiosulfate transporter family protein [Sphingomicrobium sp.]|nr:YeeE/YedE thiosulfate transporter family protein [Sphingomicrobium sp.]
MTGQTIAEPVIGGLLIGSAAGLLLILSGRIAGVSGMVARSLMIADAGPSWTQATTFLIGLVGGALVISLMRGTPNVTITSSAPVLIAGGLLVGFGTRLGNGCTSGHGVCGLARLSPRSFAATATFMTAAMATVFLVRHVWVAS